MSDIDTFQATIAMLDGVDSTTPAFKKFVADLLSRVDPFRPFGTELFNAIVRVSTGIAFEAVLFRIENGVVEVFLRRRSLDDTAYPGEWHAPGSFFRPREKNHDVAERLQSEFGAKLSQYNLVNSAPLPDDERCSGLSQIFLVQLDGFPRLDDWHGWFSVENLPENTIHSHRDIVIPLALSAFSQHLKSLEEVDF